MRRFPIIILLILFSQHNLWSAESVNMLVNYSFDILATEGAGFEDPAFGQWKYYICDENGTKGSFYLQENGHTGKCINIDLSQVPSGDVWSCLLSQDLKDLRATRYEFVFWVKADHTGNSAINVSAIDKQTNLILTNKIESGFRYSDKEWLPCVTYIDLSNYSEAELKNIRLSLHFSEKGSYLIDDLSFRPIYDVPFNVSDGISTLTDVLAFDTPLSNGFTGNWSVKTYNTPINPVEPTKVGGANDYVMMRYTDLPEMGSKPIEGEHNLNVEVTEVNGNPTYQIALVSRSIASEAYSKRVRFSFWARTDNEGKDLSVKSQTFTFVPRFQTSSGDVIQLSNVWKQYVFDYDLAKMSSPEYPYFRFEFNEVNNYQIDALLLEYIDIPENSTGVEDVRNIPVPFIDIVSQGVKISSLPYASTKVYTTGGIMCASVKAGDVKLFSLPKGTYIANWQDENGISTSKVFMIK